MADYTGIVRRMKSRYQLRVRKWRRQMSGCAWSVRYADGRSINWIESPRPKTPISLAIFLHEVAHHIIGFSGRETHCEEEYRAWTWAVRTMRGAGIEPDHRVQRRIDLSMRHAVRQSFRRGVRRLPSVLQRYAPRAA